MLFQNESSFAIVSATARMEVADPLRQNSSWISSEKSSFIAISANSLFFDSLASTYSFVSSFALFNFSNDLSVSS